jgi:acetyl esterase
MPLHPDARAFLDAMGKVPQPYEMPLADFRKAVEGVVNLGEALAIGRVEDRVVAGGDGQNLAIRLYAPASNVPLPVIVWLHGGSFTRGTLDTFDAGRRAFAKFCNCIIVAVDQRLSPEAHFPRPLEDAYAAAVWASKHAAEFGGNPALIGVGGESSGGNLAAALTLLARERGGPAFSFQILLMPLVDATCTMPSVDELAEGYVLTKGQLLWCYEQYAPGVQRTDPLLSPLHAPDLSGLPPAVIITIEYDPVRDEGEHYAACLAAAGVPVRTARVEGMVHHFPGQEAFHTIVKLTRETIDSLPGSSRRKKNG